MSARTFQNADLARAAGIAHFVASFGLTLAVVLVLRAHSRSFWEGTFPAFATVYAGSAVLAFATFLLSILRAPKGEVGAQSRSIRWIFAAQASFFVQAVLIALYLRAHGFFPPDA